MNPGLEARDISEVERRDWRLTHAKSG